MISAMIVAILLAAGSSSSIAHTCNRSNDDAGDYVQPWEICDDDFVRRKAPRFDDYIVDRMSAFKSVLPRRFDGPDAQQNALWLEAILDRHQTGKYQFAGHYLFVERGGCGMGCHRAVIVDLHDGKIYQPPELELVAASVNNLPDSLCSTLEIDCLETFTVRKNSKLIVLVGAIGDDTRKRGIYFFKWDDNKLKLLSKVEKSPYTKSRRAK